MEKRLGGALLKHSKVLRLARGWDYEVAGAEAGQSQDDRRSVGALLGM